MQNEPSESPIAEAEAPPVETQSEVRLVGIGASAGGLEALRVLLESLPESDVLAYVIAQHVSPTHVSMLKNLLAPTTRLRVTDLLDGQVPEAGVVYITPPNRDVVLRNGKLRLTEPQAAIGPKPSVNHFFHSLAESVGERAIAIILSGTGSDGASGIRAIKAAGGFTIAQEPESAKYDGMPKAAIHTGSVDLILEPSEIGPALGRLSVLGNQIPDALAADEETDEYAQISNLVRLSTAFKLSDYKPATVKRRIARRMNLVGTATLADYIRLLRSSREEALLLMRDTFISVTSFFRDTEAFHALEKALAEIIRGRNDGDLIRCWVPACASGEEVYSIAMVIEDCLSRLNKRGVQYMIFASDMDDEVLEFARAALYAATELESVPKAFRDQFMEQVGDHYRVSKSIRNRVVFTRQNVIEDPPFSRIDLISCRNLLIYFIPSVQRRVLEIFHYSLNATGYLFLGKSESVDRHDQLFQAENSRMRLYRRTDGNSAYQLPALQGIRNVRGARRSGEENAVASGDLIGMRTLEVLADHYAPPTVVINGDDHVVHFQGDLKPFFHFPKSGASLYLFDMVEPAMRAELRALVYRCRRGLDEVLGSVCNVGVAEENKRLIRPVVRPLNSGQKTMLLLSFQPALSELAPAADPALVGEYRDNIIIGALEQELANTRAHLNIVVEELETSNEELQSLNEELQSTNEELQSTNEELQTSNEELQSTNEELLTVNEELQVKSAELEATAAELTNVKESLTSPLVVVDATLRVVQANAACRAVVAVDGPLEGCSLTSVQWLVDVAGLAGHVRQVMRNGEDFRATVSTESGHFFQLRVMPFRESRGAVTGAVLLFDDITETHRNREELRISNERFDLAVRGSSDGLWDWDIARDSLYLAPRFKEMLGYAEDELESTFPVWESLLHPDDRQATIDAVAATLDHGAAYQVEYRLRQKSGQYVWVRAHGQVVARAADGTAARMAGSISDISQQERLEQFLREATLRVDRIIDLMPEAVLVIDDEGVIVRANAQAAEIFDYPVEELQGLSIEQLVPEPMRHQHRGLRRQFATDPAVRAMGTGRELLAVRKGGATFPVEVALAPFSDGGSEQIIASIGDITARKAADNNLRSAVSRLVLATKAAEIGVWQWDLETNALSWDERLLRLYEVPADVAATGITYAFWRSRVLAEDIERAEHELSAAQAGGRAYDSSFRIRLPDKSIRHIQSAAVLERDSAGKPVRFVGINRDLTREVQMQEILRDSERKFHSATHHAPIGMALVDPAGRFLEVNPALCQIIGYPESELLELDFQSITHADDLQTDLEFVRRMLAGEIATYQMEKRYLTKAGATIWVELDVSLVRDEAGEPRYFISQLQDITARRQLQQELREQSLRAEAANVAKSRFLANMSHEIRTPLNAIAGMTYLVLHEGVSPRQADRLGKVMSAGQHLLEIINAILDLSKIESGKVEVASLPLRPADIVATVLNMQTDRASAKGLALVADCPNDGPVLLGDPTRLQQALLNYVANAIKFTESGSVTVSVRCVDDLPDRQLLRFEVVDTGVGIAEGDLPQLFQPFEQVDSSRTRSHGGTGLGLAITRRLAEMMGGESGVSSEAGKGSTFWFTVDLVKASSTEFHEPAAPISTLGQQGDGARVLLVDDDALNRQVTGELLTTAGYHVTEARGGREALSLAAASNFEVILLDLQMPDIEGTEVARRIRTDERHQRTPIIALTANAFESDRQRCFAAGMNDFLTKPVTPELALATLARWAHHGGAG